VKLLGLNGNHLLLLRQRLKGLDYSTHYSDQPKILLPEREKLQALSRHLNTEITIAAPYLLTLENLATRYFDDGQTALKEHNVAYHIRYLVAHDRAKIIINGFYACLEPVI
jgi:hypothetical protein